MSKRDANATEFISVGQERGAAHRRLMKCAADRLSRPFGRLVVGEGV